MVITIIMSTRLMVKEAKEAREARKTQKAQDAREARKVQEAESFDLAAEALAEAEMLWNTVRNCNCSFEKACEVIRLYERVIALCDNASSLGVDIKPLRDEATNVLRTIRG